MKKWIEIIPLLSGSYAVSIEGEGDDAKPCLYDSEGEVLEEIAAMQADYNEQIEAGERDEGDEYEGVCHKADWDGEELILLDEFNEPIYTIDWRSQL